MRPSLGVTSASDLPLFGRALGLAQLCPTAVLTGWAGLQMHDAKLIDPLAPVLFRTPGNGQFADDALRAFSLHGAPGISASTIDTQVGGIAVESVAVCTIDCLVAIRSGRFQWWVPDIEGFSFDDIRMIQMIDTARTFCGLTWDDLVVAASGRFLRSELFRLATLSDPGAESPRETFLRLIVRDLAEWQSQRVFYNEYGIKLTAADLACEEFKVALFYDGEHHLRRNQRDHDSEVLQQLRMQGWEVLRFTNKHFLKPQVIRDRVQEMLRRGGG